FPLLFFAWMTPRTRALSSAAYLTALLLSVATWQYWTDPLQVFYLTRPRFWELAAGVLCFQATVLLRERSKKLPAAHAIALAAAFLLTLSLFYKLPSTARLGGAVLSTVLLCRYILANLLLLFLKV